MRVVEIAGIICGAIITGALVALIYRLNAKISVKSLVTVTARVAGIFNDYSEGKKVRVPVWEYEYKDVIYRYMEKDARRVPKIGRKDTFRIDPSDPGNTAARPKEKSKYGGIISVYILWAAVSVLCFWTGVVLLNGFLRKLSIFTGFAAFGFILAYTFALIYKVKTFKEFFTKNYLGVIAAAILIIMGAVVFFVQI